MIKVESFVLTPSPRVKRVSTLLGKLGWRSIALEAGGTLRYDPQNSCNKIETNGLAIRVEYVVAEQ